MEDSLKYIPDFIDNNCDDNALCNYTNIKICQANSLKDREFCLHQPPTEMALKIVGT